ncbi:MAG: ring-hydroxylating oxygenase subunit alpha, partial [Alphaproteobacteria bacterium]
WIQDAACQSGVMPIYDRTQEHLGASDTGIVMTRRFLLDAIRAYGADGVRPAGVERPETFMVRAVSLRLPVEADWTEDGAAFMTARIGADFGYAP